MLRRIYNWTLRRAADRHALLWLVLLSFSEASFFPIPTEAMLVPMVIARREKAWLMAWLATLASVVGALFGYAIGYYLYNSLGGWLIHLYGLEGKAHSFQDWYARYGAIVILVKGLTPIPFKLVTIASGFAHYNILSFLAAAFVSRGLRFFCVAGLLRRYGKPIEQFIEKRLTLVASACLLLLVGGFALVKVV